MSKPRVLMIGPGRNVKGGIATVVENYYKCGLDKSIELNYISTMEDASRAKKLAVAAKAYVTFAGLLNHCEIVHVHMAAQASFNRKAMFVEKAYKARKKIIIHQHAADFDKYFFEQVNETKRKRIKKIFSLADKVIVLSEEWADFFGGNICNPKTIEVLYNGVLMPEYEKDNYGDHNVLMLGRLGERKGTYDLLRAIPKVLESIPDVIFYLGGDGDVTQCKSIVTQAGLEEHVKILGWVRNKDKEEYLKKCSTFILPSYHEGMPMAILEAMSYGMATISTNAGGIPQIIEQGISGIRVESGDIEGIADALISVLRNKEIRTQLGRNGFKRIRDKFDFRVNEHRLVEIYREVLG